MFSLLEKVEETVMLNLKMQKMKFLNQFRLKVIITHIFGRKVWSKKMSPIMTKHIQIHAPSFKIQFPAGLQYGPLVNVFKK